MLFGTLTSQLEMFSFGVVSNQGIDFFKLFKQEQVQSPELKVSHEDVHTLWPKIDKENKGYITKDDAVDYMARKDKKHMFIHLMAQLNKYLSLMDKPWLLGCFFILVAILKGLSTFTQGYTTSLVAIRVSQQLRQDYFDHIQSLPMSFYNRYNIGTLSVRVSGDAGMVAMAINSFLVNYFQTPFTIISTLIALYYISPNLFSLIFFVLPPLIIPIWILTRKVKKITRAMQRRQEQFASVLYEFLAGIQTIKSYAMEEISSKKYSNCNQTVVDLEEKGSRYGHSLRPILHFFGTLFLVGIIMWGFYIAHMSLTEILVFCGFLSLLYDPIKKFADENMHIQRGVVSAERIMEVMSINPEIDDKPEAIKLTEFKERIEFKDVVFKYHPEQSVPVLDHFNLSIDKGEFIAIVGPTGVGKSTIVQLLLRLYEVNDGSICIDGVDLRDISQKSLRLAMAYVPQKPFLFFDSVAANIAFGYQENEEELVAAAKAAHAHEFIMDLPHGYQTILSEMGKDLSGGQQQRMALARALYRKSPILILDEATSALDVLTEEKVKEALESLRGIKTLIVIAHRLSTIAHADRIIFMDPSGEIYIGKHAELLKKCPGFAQMWHSMITSDRSKRKV